MATDFKLPDLGEGIHEAEILAVKVKEGEAVKEDQPILEVETDKAVVEIPCPVEGTVQKVHVKAGDTVTVGSVMITFDAKGSQPVATKKETVAAASAPLKVAAGGNGKSLPVGGGGPVLAAPATRRMARELGVDLRLIKGSGPAGRVCKEDVRAFAEGVPGSAISVSFTGGPVAKAARSRRSEESGGEPFVAQPLTAQPVELPDFAKFGPVERVPMRSIRRKIALNMTQSWSHIPHVTHGDEADITQIEEFRSKQEKIDKSRRLTPTVFMLKAVVSGLQLYPEFNSSLDEKTGEIIYKNYYNIGIAVATERGLIVPVIRNVEKKSLVELAAELAEVAAKTREGKIDLDRLQGGTFTITNIGAIGGTMMVPMINFPEAAILGMGRGVQKPVVRDGNIVIRTIMPLALSFDHRITDGAEAAYFVRHVADIMENPLTLLLEK